nr:putative RNA-directed DNA polymerase, eukaryota, reverse transcriptase zinc-binding domain protein [Tanacetum cinerariifolium]
MARTQASGRIPGMVFRRSISTGRRDPSKFYGQAGMVFGEFTVASVRKLIDDIRLPKVLIFDCFLFSRLLFDFIVRIGLHCLNLPDLPSIQMTGVNREKDRRSFSSNEDLTRKISHSVFVTNFPDFVNSRDLWNKCSVYRMVVDVFIPLRNLKQGSDSHSSALLRFLTLIGGGTSYAFAVNGNVQPVQHGSLISTAPALVLDDECVVERDYSMCAMGKVKGHSVHMDNQQSPDPFSINDLLSKKTVVVEPLDPSPSLSHPPGFSHAESLNLRGKEMNMDENIIHQDKEVPPSIIANVMNNSHVAHDGVPLNSGGGSGINKWRSVLGVLEEMVRVGLGNKSKKEWVKELTNNNKLNFIAIQETKMEKVSHMDVKFMWGNSNYDFVFSESVGNSGGILCMWEESIFKKDYVTISDSFVAIYGTWIPNKTKILIVSIYAPQQPSLRRVLWNYLLILLGRWNGESILMGDFNEVRTKEERCGTSFNSSNASFFNQFISSSGLIDIKIEGYSYTWSHPSAEKMSKLDRFLVSEGILNLFHSITTLCLDRHLSDHRPILLREVKVDFGPIPFRFYHSWFNLSGFDEMVEHTWSGFDFSDNNKMIRFKKKLQELKRVIRLWIRDKKSQIVGSKNLIVLELRDIDKKLDQLGPNDFLFARRHELKCNLNALKEMEMRDAFQKLKVRWAIEGDENSSYFHGIINKKRSHIAIRGVFDDGIWRTDPTLVKRMFHEHYETHFNKPSSARLRLNFHFPNRLSTVQVADLEKGVSHDEIRSVVWDCEDNKSSGPDGYTFELFKKFWKCIRPDLCEAVEHFFKYGSFSKGCNSSFIALIPKVMDAKHVNDYRPISLIGSVYKVILDGPFVLNEVLDWCKRKNKQAMFFKVDFAKAYDSVRWDYLIDVLEAFGFGSIWCNWIRGTFGFAKASILVNGSPSDEFHLHCGFKQGDPLSTYLFILVMESLHLSVNRAVLEGVFKGIQLHESLALSHLFYADDALFMGEWSNSNLSGIINILKCFHLASGLKINIQKSQVLGVGVPRSSVEYMASYLGCSIMEKKFRYLGVMVGEKMSRFNAWDDVVLKLKARLSKWKAKTLSIGGRLTLLKSVLGASPLYNMSIFKVPKGILKVMESIRSNFLKGLVNRRKKYLGLLGIRC